MARSAAGKKVIKALREAGEAQKKLDAKKAAEKAELSKLKRLLRGGVCNTWEARIRGVRSMAEARRLWRDASRADRHQALYLVEGRGLTPCQYCGDNTTPFTFALLRKLAKRRR